MLGATAVIVGRLLAASAVSVLAWIVYQLTIIWRRGVVLARQFPSPPARNKLMGKPPPPSLSQPTLTIVTRSSQQRPCLAIRLPGRLT